MEKIMLTEEIKNQILTEIENTSEELYWDCRRGLEDSSINECLEKGTYNFMDELYDYNVDSIIEIEAEIKRRIVSEYAEKLNMSVEELIEELGEDFEDTSPSVYIDLKDVFRREYGNVRLELYSNYDCINSNWCEGNSYSFKESYFGAMVNALNLNPKLLKEEMHKQNIETRGAFPNYKWRNGKEFVDYSEFCKELLNSCCGVNLLTVGLKIGLLELHENVKDGKLDNIKKITIPKGAYCGLFSSMQGGGSIMEIEFKKAVTIDLTKTGKTKYDCWGLVADKGYSINEVYSMPSSFFSELDIVE